MEEVGTLAGEGVLEAGPERWVGFCRVAQKGKDIPGCRDGRN